MTDLRTATLRTAAQQALEALEDACGDRCNAEYNREVAETLRAALVEDAMQKFTDVNQELEAALAEPVQEPVAWRFKLIIASPWSLSDDAYYISCKRDKRYIVEPLYAAPPASVSEAPQRKPLTVTKLQEALVYTNLIDRDAIDDPDNYDDGSTLAQIDELHRILGGMK